MAALTDYARLVVFASQVYLTQLTSVSMKTESGQQPVNLLNEGLAGFTPGSGSVTIEVGYAIPIGGEEFEFQKNCAQGSYITMQIGVGAKAYAGTGKVMSCDISQSAGAAVEATLTWMGELKPLQ